MRKESILFYLILVLILAITVSGCRQENKEKLTLATTTSTDDSGLLREILPIFESEQEYNVEVIAVGTGQALEVARRGDADILLAHALEQEEEFVADGYGTERYPVMYNYFLILGPKDDPAGVKAKDCLAGSLEAIAETGLAQDTPFLSRGDDSGTHSKELMLWDEYKINIEGEWYKSLGQGMGDILITANEMRGYTLADWGTYISMQNKLVNLEVVFAGDENLYNPYGIIPVNPELHNVNYEGAKELVEFFLRDDIQEKIGEFGKDEFGESLFFTDGD